ncbi:MAG TPA: ABC transporter ATP-binding protein, partial [Chloroflexota bacterium]|nr:ABC transporter ATP-binding protein [Chloroflexota bacterium]
MELAIETNGLARSFGHHAAVAGVDMAVPERSVFGFLGPNGAGKTTTIRLLLGLLKPSAGSATIFGLDAGRQRRKVAGHVGALVEVPSLYPHLTGRENLSITQRLRRAAPAEIDRVLDVVDLARDADRRVDGYSLGMRQRLGVARALVGKPRLLILDEPSNGLDPSGILDMRRLIASFPEREGVTVFLSSHVLAEVEQCATHVGIMHEGRLLLQSPMRTLKTSQPGSIRVQTDR